MTNSNTEQPGSTAPFDDAWVLERLQAGSELAAANSGLPNTASDEELGSFALGEMPPESASRVLESLARDPDAARLVASLYSLRRDREASFDTVRSKPGSEIETRTGTSKVVWPPRWLLATLAAAACLVLSFSTWMVVAPGDPAVHTDPILGAMGNSDSEPDYWQRLRESETPAPQEDTRVREYILFASVACTSLLTIVVCVLAARRPRIVLIRETNSSSARKSPQVPRQDPVQ
jgi:hypothetical protein